MTDTPGSTSVTPVVPVNDLARSASAESAALAAIAADVIASGRYLLGPSTERFEQELASYLDVKHVVGVANGTDALELGLVAVGCQPGDRVITVANAGGYTTAACRALGLEPRYVDVDPSTLLVSTETARAALLEGAAAIVITHLYGAVTADLDEIILLARQSGTSVIEDCAQSIGAVHRGRRAGSFGDLATFSFYPTKNLGALGDGGAIATKDATTADAIRSLHQYGWGAKYHVVRDHGRNSRLDELQAAFLRHRLKSVDARNARRRSIYDRYRQAAASTVVFPYLAEPSFVAHLAICVCQDRTATRANLLSRGIATDVHYPICDHLQPSVARPATRIRLPASEAAAESVLTLPCFPELTEREIRRVCAALNSL